MVRLRVAEGEESIALDTEELLDARWMSAEEVEARCETAEDEGKPLAGKVSRGNWEMIRHALEGAPTQCIDAHTTLHESRLYPGNTVPQPYVRLHPSCTALHALVCVQAR